MNESAHNPLDEEKWRYDNFIGSAKRTSWPHESKVAIVIESYSKQETVSAVARRYGLSPEQLFTWRRELRDILEKEMITKSHLPEISFIPVILESSSFRPLTESHYRKDKSYQFSEIDSNAERIISHRSVQSLRHHFNYDPHTQDIERTSSAIGGVVMIASRPVDLRKRPAALAALIRSQQDSAMLANVIYVFRAKHVNRIKLLWWDGTKLHVACKTFQQSILKWPHTGDDVLRLTIDELKSLLEGVASHTKFPFKINLVKSNFGDSED